MAQYTVNDIFALPDAFRCELIDGEMFPKVLSSPLNQRIIHSITKQLEQILKDLSYEAFVGPIGFFSNEEMVYLGPDVLVICSSDQVSDRGIEGAPIWLAEVGSPLHGSDIYYRNRLYFEHGITEFWTIDPAKREVGVHRHVLHGLRAYSFNDAVSVPFVEDCGICLADIGY